MSEQRQAQAAMPPGMRTRVAASRGFVQWLYNNRCSLLLTTYQTGQLCSVGVKPDGNLSFQEQGFARALGVWSNGQTALLAAQSVIWRFHNALAEGERHDIHDRLFQPRLCHITGDVDVHELALDNQNRVVFINTKYACLATTSDTHNFRPLWKPEFISKLVPEDRCHLNGLGMVDGKPRYVTLVGQSDVVDGWRGNNAGGGALIDITDDRAIHGDLSVPHSPRLHGGRVWLVESGRGQVVTVDPQTGAKEDVVFCPGFLRGLAFHGEFALVTTSCPRDETFRNLPLDQALKDRRATPRCAVFVINTRTGAMVEWLMFEGLITELFDVAVLPGVRAPMTDGPATPHLGTRETIEPM
jgi:uncharacterized protein (TIGR03032 family)